MKHALIVLIIARVPDAVPPEVAPVLEKELESEATFGVKLESWLMQRTRR